MLIKSLVRVASASGSLGRLSVLIFHRVLPEPDPIFPQEVHARRFDDICGWLRSWFNVLPLDKAVEQLATDTLQERAACITFDDGYADNHDVALPILQRHGIPATFFVSSGFLDGGRMWNDTIIESIRLTGAKSIDLGSLGYFPLASPADKGTAIDGIIGRIKYLPTQERMSAAAAVAQVAKVEPPDNLMMTSTQVKRLHRANMQIGAHTVSHPILARLSEAEARREIGGSKLFLEKLLGERVGLFAYPNGKPDEDYTQQNVDMVRSLGFDAAVSTRWGASGSGDDRFQIRRFTPWDKTRLFFGMRLLANLRRH